MFARVLGSLLPSVFTKHVEHPPFAGIVARGARRLPCFPSSRGNTALQNRFTLLGRSLKTFQFGQGRKSTPTANEQHA